ncbi:fungal-specific transcription factor domain-containing protein [Aspergillus multicolor]|uniref:Zn(II)2Cys6 transcription factor n=1 Tax=Aspergillus multicolor TaxID=41759 RepID=UPI003CCC8F56
MSSSKTQGVIKRRSRNGCRTCRERHQKCDERKPACWNCRLRGVECGGYGVVLTNFTAHSGQKGQMVSRLTRGGDELDQVAHGGSRQLEQTGVLDLPEVPMAPSPSILFGHQRSDIGHESEFGSLPGLPDIECLHARFLGSLDQIGGASTGFSSIDLELLGRWTADDGAKESVGHTERAIPDRMEATSISSLRTPSANVDEQEITVEFDTALFQPAPDLAIPASPQDPFDQYLFSYYMDTLSLRLYPIKLDQNPYRIVYGSLATESEPLLKVIMLASALHLAELGKLPAFAIKHYRGAVRDSFRNALEQTSSSTDSLSQKEHSSETWSLGVTVLLSVVFEIISTGIDTWSPKLIGCRRLLEMAMRSSTTGTPPGFQCVLTQYNWVVTMGKTMLKGSVPDSTMDELKCIDEASLSKDIPTPAHGTDFELAKHQSQWWDNLPDYQMHLFLREATDHAQTVHRLKASPSPGSITTLQQLMPTVADLVYRLKTWRPQTSFSAVRPEYAESVRYFNDIWRAGMLCLIYSEIYALGPRDPLIQGCVEGALAPLRKLSWLQACLFPTFMIAVHAATDEARGVFVSKLEDMHGLLGFQGPASVVEVLRCVWQRMDEQEDANAGAGGTGEGRIEWRDIVRELGMELNILL